MTLAYRLTRRALKDLKDIYAYSVERWGDERASAYVSTFYRLFEKLSDMRPDVPRSRRSTPFRMTSSQQHFVIFELRNDTVYVLAIMHQSRNVERRVAELTQQFRQDIAALN